MSNKFTDNMSKKAGDAAVNIRRSVKCYALAADIRKELDGGADLKNILQERVQSLDEAAAEADAERLVDGIRSFNTAKEVEVDTEWVRRQLNSALSSLDNKERVLYLSNVIFAVTAAFPNVKVDEETRDRINSMAAAEENSDEDVSDLTGVVNDVLPEVGTLLQKATTGSVTKRLHKVNSEQLLEIIGAGENFVTAYAAARYVQVRTGVYGFDHSDASAFTVGAASASGVESSKLVHMYFSGKITLEVLAERLRSIYTAAATVISAHAVRLMSRTAFAALGGSAVLFGFLFLLLGLRVDLFVALFASGAIASLFFGEVITVERVEAVFRAVWDGVKNVWSAVAEFWSRLLGRDVSDAEEFSAEEEAEAGDETEEASEDETANAEAEEDGDATEIDDTDEDEDEDEDEHIEYNRYEDSFA